MKYFLKFIKKQTDTYFFFKRFTLITFQVFFVIVCLIATLVYFEVAAEREKDNSRISAEAAEHALYLSAKLDNLMKQARIMQHEANSYFDKMPQQLPVSWYIIEKSLVQDGNNYSLDAMPDSIKECLGNFTGTGNFTSRYGEDLFRRELAQQFDLGSLFCGIKQEHPELTWVYTISKNHYAYIYPFSQSYVAHYDSSFHSYDIFRMGTPEVNPERKLFITPPYLDAGSKGLMVSIGAPVYEHDNFRSIVGVDVTLGFLTSYVKEYRDGVMMIVNENNQLLAHPSLIHDSDTLVRSLTEVLDTATLSQLNGKSIIELEEQRIFVQQMSSVPWKVIVLRSPGELTFERIIDRYYLVLLALICMIFFLSIYTYKHFIRPALDLVLFIDRYGNNQVVSHRKIHPSWRHWFDLVRAAFEKKQEVIYHLDEEVKRKNAELLASNIELMTQREQLVKEHQAKDRIFSILSHDLKSPISSLVGILDMLGKGNISDEEFRTLLPSVELRVKRIKVLLENLLHWSIYNLRADRIVIRPVDLNQAIQENITLLEPFAEVKSIRITYNQNDGQIVETDAAVLNLVLRNLILNAIKFSNSRTEILIWSELRENSTVVHIRDEGRGIPEAQRNRIFMFGESGPAGTQEEKGTGLGLALCKEFLEKVNGTISFISEVDKGTIFSFTLPNGMDIPDQHSRFDKSAHVQ